MVRLSKKAMTVRLPLTALGQPPLRHVLLGLGRRQVHQSDGSKPFWCYNTSWLVHVYQTPVRDIGFTAVCRKRGPC